MSVEVRSAPGASWIAAWLRMWRFHFVPLSLSAGLVGMTTPGRGSTVPSVVLGVIICVFGYGIGVVINDWFDQRADAVNAPDRPFVSGVLNPNITLGATLAMSFLLLAVTVAVAPPLAIWSAIAVGGHLLYTWTKGVPMLGNVVNGIDLALFTVLGAAAGRQGAGWLDVPAQTMVRTALIAVVLSGFCLVGYFKDIDGDKLAGYRTLPVAIGARRSSRLAPFFPATALVATAALAATAEDVLGGDDTAAFWVLFALSISAFALSLARLLRSPAQYAYEALLWYTRGTTLFILSLGAVSEPLRFGLAAVPMLVYLEVTLRATRVARQA